jgi:anti-sigma regulatory factor (ser/thr protein kinase)
METKTKEFPIEAMDLENAGSVSSYIKKALISKNISKSVIKRISIAVYEAEINVVIHSYGGVCKYTIDDECIHVIFEDTGPGIPDIEQAFKPGYSTANAQAINYGFGAGMGLINIQNASDDFHISSSPKGTILDITIRF